MVIDRERCMVGSFDVNKFERRNTAEVVVTADDARLARRIEEGFLSSLKRSREVTVEDRRKRWFFTRAAEWLSYRMMRS